MLDDLRYALRQLRLAPGFTAVALITLALATGANTALFSLFHALVLRPLPYADADRLVSISPYDDKGQQVGIPVGVIDAIAAEQGLFDAASAFLGGAPAVTVDRPGLASVLGTIDFVSGSYFSTLQLTPHIGRLFNDVDVSADASAPVAVLSYRFWQQHFNGDPAVVGRQIQLRGLPFTIVGVAPPRYSGLWIETGADITAPLPAFMRVLRIPPGAPFVAQAAVARLRSGITMEQAQSRLQSLWPSLVETIPPGQASAAWRTSMQRNRPRVLPLSTGFSFMRDRYTGPLQTLIALTAWMLLVACVNLASLLLARSAARDREYATRLALGASRWSLVRQALTEGVLLAAMGTVCGLPLAWWGPRALTAFITADYLAPIRIDVSPDVRVLATTGLVALVIAGVFALVPAVRTARREGSEALGTTRTVARGTTRWGNALLVGQFALALTLLVGAAALSTSLTRARNVDPGFEVAGLHSITLFAVPDRTAESGSATYLRALLASLEKTPGIESTAFTDGRLAGGYTRTADVARAEEPVSSNGIGANNDIISPGYFTTIRLPLVAGREFTWFDDVKSPPVAIVSASLAQRLFPEGDALGRHIRVGTVEPRRQSIEIVGIAADASVRDIRQSRPFNVFLPLPQETRPTSTPELLVRATGAPPSIADIRQIVEAPGLHRMQRWRSVDDQIDRLLLRERLMSGLAMFFAAMAAILIAIGLYGLLAFSVRTQTREIGVRLAVGASPAQVRGMIISRGIRLATIGCLIGLPLALFAGRALQDYLFQVEATDIRLLAGVGLFVLALTLAAAYLPARLASRVDPASALRAE